MQKYEFKNQGYAKNDTLAIFGDHIDKITTVMTMPTVFPIL